MAGLDGITDWRSWTNQQEIETGTLFPGQNAISDAEIITNNGSLIVTPATLGSYSIPTYSNVPTTINAVDPFVGWTCQQSEGQFGAAQVVLPSASAAEAGQTYV
jgi:hypothetical protein